MSKLLWLIGGTALALAVFAILNASELAPADDTDRAAGEIAGWGVRQRATGAGNQLFGRAEKLAGDVMGNGGISDRGIVDQAGGAVQNAIGQTAQAVGQTIHDLNK